MNAQQRAHFRRVLEARKAELGQDIERLGQNMYDLDTRFADPGDQASHEWDTVLVLCNSDRDRRLIAGIDKAIARIDADEYGYCEKCGVEIALERLEARPTATFCVDCKQVEELRDRRLANSRRRTSD